jgi:hypothetical protein
MRPAVRLVAWWCALGVPMIVGTLGCSSPAPEAGPLKISSGLLPAATTSAAAAILAAARVQTYLDSIYKLTDVSYSFTTQFGETIDCIPFTAEPGVKSLGAKGIKVTPPTPPVMPFGGATTPGTGAFAGVAFDGTADEDGNARRCPSMTVPHVRLTADRIARVGGLDAFQAAVASKRAPGRGALPPDPGETNGFLHVYGEYQQELTGGAAVFSLFNPNLPGVFTNAHSIAQTWTTDATSTQTVEIGWNVDYNLYGDSQTHLFINATNDGYVTTGCYNNMPSTTTRTCLAFVPVVGGSFTPGMVLPHGSPGAPTSGQYEVRFGTLLAPIGWWIAIGQSQQYPLGAYWYTNYSGEMQTDASIYEFGGEVSAPDEDTSYSALDGVWMGSGKCGEAGFLNASYVHDYEFADPNYNAQIQPSVPLTSEDDEPAPQRYDWSTTPAPGSSSWINYFYFGGTGSPGCTQQSQPD